MSAGIPRTESDMLAGICVILIMFGCFILGAGVGGMVLS